MIPRRRPEIDQAWNDYQAACDKLREMRDMESTATAKECELQLQHSEKLLQQWIELTQHFSSTMN